MWRTGNAVPSADKIFNIFLTLSYGYAAVLKIRFDTNSKGRK